MYTVNTKVSFEAAHRLYNVDTYSKECRDNLHGHSYKVEIVVGADSLNSAGMVIDFKLLKTVIREEIESKYDHSCILRKCDPIANTVKDNCKKVILVDESPTAEWMAKEFFTTKKFFRRWQSIPPGWNAVPMRQSVKPRSSRKHSTW